MNVVWSPEAVQDLVHVRTFIAEDDRQAAKRVALHIIDSIERLLPEMPHMGRPGRVPGTRELVVAKTPFVVPYRQVRGAIQILRVYHATRQWPERL